MADLVTVEEARAHLRIDNDADDAWLATWILAISQAVFTWLKDEWRAYELLTVDGVVVKDSNDDPIILEDSNGPVIKPLVTAACLVELASQYRFRDGNPNQTFTGDLYNGRYGYILSQGATALLQALRKTTVV